MYLARYAALSAVLGSLVTSGCSRAPAASRAYDDASPWTPGVAPLVAASMISPSGRPRIVLTTSILDNLHRQVSKRTPRWRRLAVRCKNFAREDSEPGYMGLMWGEAVASLALCWQASGERLFADAGVRYLRALLDDRIRIGDGRGGNTIVRRNSGYAMRSHATYAAIGYDWLHDAPSMDDELRTLVHARLSAWITWYERDGYLNDNPFSNYYWGYLSALSMAALSVHGEYSPADTWLKDARERHMIGKVLPGFRTKLAGGDWGEGWQYGNRVAMMAALTVLAHRTASNVDFTPHMPWFEELVDSHVHALHPDRTTSHGNGTHKIQPPHPNATALHAAALVLSDTKPEKAAQARNLISERRALPPKHSWFELLSSTAGTTTKPIRDPDSLSYHLTGPGLSFMRESWKRNAVWVSFQAGTRIAVDHQNNDQGHFEIWRGGDGLLIDNGGGIATINHNTLLVHGPRRGQNYTPNQGVWGDGVSTTGFADTGKSVVVVGELGEAYRPKCATVGCKERSLSSATRTLVYARPNVAVVFDELVLTSPNYRAVWAGHVARNPTVTGPSAQVKVGKSRLNLFVVEPAEGRFVEYQEPTNLDEHPYRGNHPPNPSWRLELESKTGDKRRRFATWMFASAAGDRPTPPPVRIEGTGVVGATMGDELAVFYVLHSHSAIIAKLPARGAKRAVIAGLSPSTEYTITAERSGEHCAVRVAAGSGAMATQAGSLDIGLDNCKVTP